MCLIIGVRLVNGPFIKEVRDFNLQQNNKGIDVTWKSSKKEKSWVLFYDDSFLPDKMKVKDGKKNIPVKKVPKEYKVAIISFDGFGLPKYSSKTIYLKTLEQTIKIAGVKDGNLTGDKAKITAKAKGKITYSSSNKDVATVDKNGNIKYKKEGVAFITVNAAKGDYYNQGKERLQVRVYPKELKTPTVSSKDEGPYTELKWKEVKYADKYVLYRYNKQQAKYVAVKEIPANQTSIKVDREDSTYKVKAVAKLSDRDIKSDESTDLAIESPSKTAPAYDSIHLLKTLNEEDFKEVAFIKNQGNAVIPQSFCYTGENYIVSLVSRLGSDGALVPYSTKGKQGKLHFAEMGYANGSTYNPNTGKVYTVRSHKGITSNQCKTFQPGNEFKEESFELPMNASGIAYDEINGKYYLSSAGTIMVANADMQEEKKITKLRYNIAQDIGGHDGVILVTLWEGQKNSHIDLYREADGAYIGSYDIPLGEIESVTVVNKHLVVLMYNTTFKGKTGGHILMTKEPVTLP